MQALAAAFDAAMDDTGPYGHPPRLAVAVSGGADSLALSLLADAWARRRGGSVIGLIIDHGVRRASAAEAREAAALLAARSIQSRIIALDLADGPALQARARRARHEALAHAAREAGAVHLLYGHHQRDQVETASMRAARGSRGLAGMAALSARREVIILRPLLDIQPDVLRGFLRAAGCRWIEDPSNRDARFERVRVRALVEQGGGISRDSIRHAGNERHQEMEITARQLARFAEIRPEGFALWRNGTIPLDSLAVLLRVVGGRSYAPNRTALARLTGCVHGATLGGVQVTRWRKAWLFTREPAALDPPVEARVGQKWDGRFRIAAIPEPGRHGRRLIGALGSGAAAFRNVSDLPSLILQSLPAVYEDAAMIAVPHLGFGPFYDVIFDPPAPAAPRACALHLFVFETSQTGSAGT